jgi:hypothetical protein
MIVQAFQKIGTGTGSLRTRTGTGTSTVGPYRYDITMEDLVGTCSRRESRSVVVRRPHCWNTLAEEPALLDGTLLRSPHGRNMLRSPHGWKPEDRLPTSIGDFCACLTLESNSPSPRNLHANCDDSSTQIISFENLEKINFSIMR